MVSGPFVVQRHLARACIKALPHDAAIGFVFVPRPIPGIGIPLDGHIPYKASC